MINDRKGGTLLKCAYLWNNVYPLFNPPGGLFILNTFDGGGGGGRVLVVVGGYSRGGAYLI